MSLPIMFSHIGNRLGMTMLCCTLILASLPSFSANTKTPESTKSYPVTVSADQLISQSKAGQSEYRGNVQLNRNKLELHGDQLNLVHPNDKLQLATVKGNPATFKDYLSKKQQWVDGEAKQILFDQDKDTITLLNNASMVMDNGNRIHAEKIIIYNKDETFEANGSKQHGRVKMTIQSDN